jgi:SlyX protein
MNSKSDIRLTELERHLAHHERMTEDLSEILAKQTRAVDELSQRLHRLTDRVAALEAGGGGAPSDDQPPPHY